jgi:hypothetical protein
VSGAEVQKTFKVKKYMPNIYFRVVWDLWEAGKPVNEENVSFLLKAYGVKLDREHMNSLLEVHEFLDSVCEE